MSLRDSTLNFFKQLTDAAAQEEQIHPCPIIEYGVEDDSYQFRKNKEEKEAIKIVYDALKYFLSYYDEARKKDEVRLNCFDIGYAREWASRDLDWWNGKYVYRTCYFFRQYKELVLGYSINYDAIIQAENILNSSTLDGK